MDKKINSNNYKCPNCGAQPEFDTKTGSLKCPFCNSTVDVSKKVELEEIQLYQLLSNNSVWKETEVVECSNCGSREIISKGKLCTSCPFCGTTNIVKTSEIVGMTPHGICTFRKSTKEATEIVKAWTKKGMFTPNQFKKKETINSLQGVYSPAFTFDCESNSSYKGRLGETHTKTTTDRDGKTHTESYTTYFHISGSYDHNFDDLIIHTSSSIPAVSLQNLEPFPTKECTPYEEKFLTGYTANTSSKEGKETWEDFKLRSKGLIRSGILKKYHYDIVDYLDVETTYTNAKFKYLLLPVYVGHHKYKDKNYNFYVNGCTGKVVGKKPVSGLKIFFFVLGILGIVGLPILLALLTFFM